MRQKSTGATAGWLFAMVLIPLVIFADSSFGQNRATNGEDFDRQAFAALPSEPSYTFARELSEGLDRELGRRDAAAKPAAGEMAIANHGWSVVIGSGAGSPLREAAQALRSYLGHSMQVELAVEEKASLADASAARQAIVAGTRDELPGCGAELKAAKDYQIMVSPEQVVVCGYDEAGAMYGLYNLEERFSLREAPYLPRSLDTVRHSLYKARMTLSGLGWMEWPDAYLAMLARYGFDSIYASVYDNPNGVGGPPPFWDKMRKQDPARVHDLVRRAGRYGIKLYCPMVYLYTGTPENEEGLRKLVRDIVTEFPEIRGYILLTEGFFYQTWFGAGGQGKLDLREWTAHWAQGVRIVTEECKRLNPAIEVLPWNYNIDFRPQYTDLHRFSIDQLPLDSIPLVTFENGKGFEFDGEHSSVSDYSISQVGPAEVAEAQIKEAQRRGMRGMYSKADTWASWQFGTFPYLPFPFQWYARYRALEKSGVDGTMESWSYGFKPNFVAELRNWYSWSDAPPLETLLRQIARRNFGAGSEDLVLSAWKEFSTAITKDPDTGPTSGGNAAVANPLFFQPPREHIMTLAHSWTDQGIWSREADVNPYWPYCVRQFVLYPDFTNQANAAENYAKPMSLPVFNKYLLEAANEMATGLASYRAAALKSPAPKRSQAFREVLLAAQIERMLRSNQAVLEFEDLRYHLAKTNAPEEQKRYLDRMTEILKAELARTNLSLATARRDSRLGYEWEEDYIYWPDTLEKKIRLLKETLDLQVPTYRRLHKIP
jgi:hypothetical protein